MQVPQSPTITPLSISVTSSEWDSFALRNCPHLSPSDIESIEIEWKKGTAGTYSETTLTLNSTTLDHYESSDISKFCLCLSHLVDTSYQNLSAQYEGTGTLYIKIKAITINGTRTEFP